MKWQSPLSGLVGAALALSSTTIFTQPSYAESSTFRCVTRNGGPTTTVYTSSNDGSREEVSFLNWHRAFSSPRAEKLCQEVSQKLQSHSKNTQGISLTTGQVKDKFVVCFTKNSNERCSLNNEILFALTPTDNPNRVLSKLLDSSGNNALNESSGRTYGNVRFSLFGFKLPELL